MKDIFITVVSVLLCSGFWTFIQFLITRKDGKKEAMKELQKTIKQLQEDVKKNNTDMALQNEALMSMAQDRIVWLGEQYLKQGFIYINDASSLKRMADAYAALGGNSLVEDVMEQIELLPRKVKGA